MRRIAVVALLAAFAAETPGTRVVGSNRQSPREEPMHDHPFAGSWVANFSKSNVHPTFQYRAVTLDIEVSGENVTLASRSIGGAGNEIRAGETFRTDGTVKPGTLTPGVSHVARWLGPDVLATIARRDGRTVALVTYEVSADRKSLTSRSSGLLEQVIVFDRRSVR